MESDRSIQQKIALGIGLGLLAGATLWLVSLLFVASHISGGNTIEFDLKFGPLSLTTLSRSELANGGTMATISLHGGLLWFLLCCAVAGGTISLYRVWVGWLTDGKAEGHHQSGRRSGRAGHQ